MYIKTKLSLGIGFLLLLIILLTSVSAWYFRALSGDTRNILVANYNTIDYSRQMLVAMDENRTLESSKRKFEEQLLKQQKNVTEAGETWLTQKLSADFKKTLENPEDTFLYKAIRKDLTQIIQLNMQAIQRKSTLAEHTALFAVKVIAVTGSICFLLALVLLLMLPGNIANPIQKLDLAKTHFIASVSHEFKTPISSIKMSVQLLENERVGELNAEQKYLLEGIKDDAARLLKITGELLNMTQIESGNIQVSMVPSDAKEILQYAVQATKTQAAQKQVILETQFSDQLPSVHADREKTVWVLINLISNAIRYSNEGSKVLLGIAADQGDVKFSVTDSGPGIAEEYKRKIFDRYFRIPQEKAEGTGLGLAISKEFIEAQSGHIGVTSEWGRGSTFYVILKKGVS